MIQLLHAAEVHLQTVLPPLKHQNEWGHELLTPRCNQAVDQVCSQSSKPLEPREWEPRQPNKDH